MSSEVLTRPSRADVADRLTAAVTDVPGVVALGRGGSVAAATYAGTRRIPGVVVRPDRVVVYVEVDRLPLPPVVAAVRDAVATVLRDVDRPAAEIVVVVENLRLERLPGNDR